MTILRPLTIGDKAPYYSADDARFFNLMLEIDRIRYAIDPIIDSVCHNIEFAYKSPAKIDFISAIPSKNSQLAHCVQLNEICVRFLHLESGQDFFLTVESRLARTFLSRLLANSLVDESPHLLFSSTEKGIFNFIMARLLCEMKKSLHERMPSLKILGIFHAVDDVIKEFKISSHGACNFVVNFAADQYHVVLFCPTQMLELGFTRAINKDNLLARGGHIKYNLAFIINYITMPVITLQSLACGDLIIFDNSSLSYKNQELSGTLHARWSDFTLSGRLEIANANYQFVSTALEKHTKGAHMKDIEITGSLRGMDQSQLSDMARNLRVSVSIEISRLPMSLQELCDLKIGEIINLHRKLDDPLELVVEGKIIGFCTPVQIDGRLGVKILHIDSHDKN